MTQINVTAFTMFCGNFETYPFLVQFSVQVCQVRRWRAESSLLFCSVCRVLYDKLVLIVQENECHRWKCKSLQLTITLLLGNCWFVCHLFIAICSTVFVVDVITQHTKHQNHLIQDYVHPFPIPKITG